MILVACIQFVYALSAGSEGMSLVQLIVPTEVAHDTVYELGELGNVQFKDVSIEPEIWLQFTNFY